MIIPEKPKFDFSLLITVVLLQLIGVACIYSATRYGESEMMRGLFRTQLTWIALGFVLFAIVALLPFRFYYSFSYFIYAATIVMLLYLEVAGGHTIKGAVRWINIGGIRIQPSEYAKIGLLLALSRYLSSKPVSLTKLSSLVVPAIIIIIPFTIILKQPDLGTAMILALMSLPILFAGGMSVLEIFLLVSPFLSMVLSFNVIPWGIYFITLFAVLYFSRQGLMLASIAIFANIFTAGATAIAWNFLHDYQKARILTFIDPGRDPFGAGYQIIQSKVAIGSGRFWGKGFLQGTQTKLSFLPEQHTDFIFSVFGEQFGFIGAIFLMLLFFFLIYRGLSVVKNTKNRFIILISVGATSTIGFHIFTNLAMAVGMMPVAGIPLPFLSYGGSFLSTCMILVGLIAFARKSANEF